MNAVGDALWLALQVAGYTILVVMLAFAVVTFVDWLRGGKHP